LIHYILESKSYSIKTLNLYFPNKEALYDFLVIDKGLYLPDLGNTRCVTEEYLQKVLKKEVFTIKALDVHPTRLVRKVKKEELYEEINNHLELDLGFDEKNLPDKAWLIHTLKALIPDHAFFQHPEPELLRTFPEE